MEQTPFAKSLEEAVRWEGENGNGRGKSRQKGESAQRDTQTRTGRRV